MLSTSAAKKEEALKVLGADHFVVSKNEEEMKVPPPSGCYLPNAHTYSPPSAYRRASLHRSSATTFSRLRIPREGESSDPECSLYLHSVSVCSRDGKQDIALFGSPEYYGGVSAIQGK